MRKPWDEMTKPMLDGLYPYEVLMLCAGATFFILLLWAFVYQIRAGSLGASLVIFFVIDIAMIGFPAMKEIQYKDGVLTLETDASELQNEPANSVLRSSLQKTLEDVLPRVSSGHANAKSLVTVAAAQYALGKEAGAKTNLRRALSGDESSPAALELKQKIEAVDRVGELTAKLKANPADSGTFADLHAAVQQVSDLKLANPKALTTVALAQDVLGDHKEAAANKKMANTIFRSNSDFGSGPIGGAMDMPQPGGASSSTGTGTTKPHPGTGIPKPPGGPSRPLMGRPTH